MKLLRTVAATVVAALLVTACASAGSTAPPAGSPAGSAAGGSASAGPSVLPQIISSELGVGENRVLFSFLDRTGTRPAATPDRTAKVTFVGPGGETVDAPDGTFVWAIPNERGVYYTHANFPTAGTWQAEFTTSAPGSPPEKIRFGFDVKAQTNVLRPGAKAPTVNTPTLSDVGGEVARISTDQHPVDRFYQTSEDAAVASGKPFVLVFATPKFCTTAQCGPTLDRLKPIAAAHPDVTFINVEPYQLEWQSDQLQPVLANGQLQPVPAVTAFGLITEPYVFVVDRSGVIKASFEAIFGDQEIDQAVAAVEK